MAGLFRKKQPMKDPFDKWKNQDLREELRKMKKELELKSGEETLRIVLCGPTGSGKSATINSIMSTRNGRVVQVAGTGGRPDHVTQRYTEYKIPLGDDKDDKALLVVCDTRGIVKEAGQDSVEAVKAAVAGKYLQKEDMSHIHTDADNNGRSTMRKQASYIIIVLDATVVERDLPASEPKNSVIYQKLELVLDYAFKEAIPLSVFLTKCDLLDASVSKDITKLYKSDSVEKVRNHASQRLHGLPLNRIFPIVNYTNQLEAEDAMILHTMYALKCIVADVECYLADVPNA